MQQSEIRQIINRVRELTRNLRSQNNRRTSYRHTRNQEFMPLGPNFRDEQVQDIRKWVRENQAAIYKFTTQWIRYEEIMATLKTLDSKNANNSLFDYLSIKNSKNFEFKQKITPSTKDGLFGAEYVISSKTTYQIGVLESRFRVGAGYTPEMIFQIPNIAHQAENRFKKIVGKDVISFFNLENQIIPEKLEIQEQTKGSVSAEARFNISDKVNILPGVVFLINFEGSITKDMKFDRTIKFGIERRR